MTGRFPVPPTVEAITTIKAALSAALVEARKTSEHEGETLDIAVAMALAMLVEEQGCITSNIPVSVTRSLMETLIKRGYGEYLDMARGGETPERLQ